MESAPTESARFRPLTEMPLTHSPPPDVVGSPLPEGAFSWYIRPLTDMTWGYIPSRVKFLTLIRTSCEKLAVDHVGDLRLSAAP